MAESKLFTLGGITVDQVASRVESFLRTEKGMEVQSAQTTEGYVIQASQSKDGWKTISGTRLAITAQLAKVGEHLNVTIGEGQWSDKIGAGALGWFVAWPLAVTAGIGAYNQKKLPQELFRVIESFLMSGGRSVVVNGAGSVVAPGQVVCPQCKAQNPAGANFCCVCGAKLQNNCPNCGAPVVPGSRFCTQCGKPLG